MILAQTVTLVRLVRGADRVLIRGPHQHHRRIDIIEDHLRCRLYHQGQLVQLVQEVDEIHRRRPVGHQEVEEVYEEVHEDVDALNQSIHQEFEVIQSLCKISRAASNLHLQSE